MSMRTLVTESIDKNDPDGSARADQLFRDHVALSAEVDAIRVSKNPVNLLG